MKTITVRQRLITLLVLSLAVTALSSAAGASALHAR